MDRDHLRPLVFDILKKNPQTHLHAIENELRQRVEDYERSDVLWLHEIVWELLVQGVLAPGKNSLNLNLPFVHVTDYGGRCLDDGSILAHDPDGYVARLVDRIGTAEDALVIESAREGLLCFLSGRHPAAVICLAHAAEALFDRLIASLIHAGRRSGRSTKSLEACGRGPKVRYRAIERSAGSRKLSGDLADQFDPQLVGLQTLIGLARTDAGAPRLPSADRERTLAYLLLFPGQAQFVYHLIERIEGTTSE